jgi:hypothetical protein
MLAKPESGFLNFQFYKVSSYENLLSGLNQSIIAAHKAAMPIAVFWF